MEGEHSIYYKDFEKIGDVLIRPSVTESMFTAWFEANKIFEEAVSLCEVSKRGRGELYLLDFSLFEALTLILLFFRIYMKVNMLKDKCRK